MGQPEPFSLKKAQVTAEQKSYRRRRERERERGAAQRSVESKTESKQNQVSRVT